jgi:hypothetical protein
VSGATIIAKQRVGTTSDEGQPCAASKERDLLKPSYPSIDFERCLIIEEGRQPASAVKQFGFMGGGAVAFLAGGVMLVSAWRKRRTG